MSSGWSEIITANAVIEKREHYVREVFHEAFIAPIAMMIFDYAAHSLSDRIAVRGAEIGRSEKENVRVVRMRRYYTNVRAFAEKPTHSEKHGVVRLRSTFVCD